MSHNSSQDDLDEVLPEYDFSSGVRGKYADAFQQGYKVVIQNLDGSIEEREYVPSTDFVRLDPDVQAYFPDAKAVNAALRGLIDLIPESSTPERMG